MNTHVSVIVVRSSVNIQNVIIALFSNTAVFFQAVSGRVLRLVPVKWMPTCCMQVTLSTFVLNLTIASRSANDSVGVRRCLEAAAQLTETQSDSEAHFRLLVSIGTAVSGADDDDDAVVEFAHSLDLENFLHWCRVDGTDKIRRCSQLLAELFAR